MRREDFLKEIGETFVAAAQLIGWKNNDYAQDNDAFLNFQDTADFAVTDVETIIYARLGEKMSRLRNLRGREEEREESNETVDDTLLDAINFLAILRVWRRYVAAEIAAEIDALPETTGPEGTGLPWVSSVVSAGADFFRRLVS